MHNSRNYKKVVHAVQSRGIERSKHRITESMHACMIATFFYVLFMFLSGPLAVR
jgi:hypothetical protein